MQLQMSNKRSVLVVYRHPGPRLNVKQNVVLAIRHCLQM